MSEHLSQSGCAEWDTAVVVFRIRVDKIEKLQGILRGWPVHDARSKSPTRKDYD